MIQPHSLNLIMDIVRKITNLNFYVKLAVSWFDTGDVGSDPANPKKLGHALTIIGTRVDGRGRIRYVIKNSWGQIPNVLDINLTNFFLPVLKKDVTGLYIGFYLPIPKDSTVFNTFNLKQEQNNYIDANPDAFNEELNEYARIIKTAVRGGRKTRRFRRKLRTKRIHNKSKISKRRFMN